MHAYIHTHKYSIHKRIQQSCELSAIHMYQLSAKQNYEIFLRWNLLEFTNKDMKQRLTQLHVSYTNMNRKLPRESMQS